MKKLLLLCAAATAVPAYSAIVVEYGFGPSGGFTLAPTATDSLLVASASSISATAVTLEGNTNAQTNNAPAAAAGNVLSVTQADATVNAGKYFQFTITAGSSALDLGTIRFDFAPGGTSGPRGVQVRYSLDNFSTFETAGTVSLTSAVVYNRYEYDLVGTLGAGQTATFRFLPTSNGLTNSVRFDNIAVDASAVPEPSAFAALAGFGALGAAALRRRRRV